MKRLGIVLLVLLVVLSSQVAKADVFAAMAACEDAYNQMLDSESLLDAKQMELDDLYEEYLVAKDEKDDCDLSCVPCNCGTDLYAVNEQINQMNYDISVAGLEGDDGDDYRDLAETYEYWGNYYLNLPWWPTATTNFNDATNCYDAASLFYDASAAALDDAVAHLQEALDILGAMECECFELED